jgi:hypothetical protein
VEYCSRASSPRRERFLGWGSVGFACLGVSSGPFQADLYLAVLTDRARVLGMFLDNFCVVLEADLVEDIMFHILGCFELAKC